MKVLIAGDTGRWIERVKKSVPEDAIIKTGTSFAHAIEHLFYNNEQFDICIVAGSISERNDGLKIVQELQEDTDPRVIIYTREFSEADKATAEELGAVVVEMNLSHAESDTNRLAHAVKSLVTR